MNLLAVDEGNPHIRWDAQNVEKSPRLPYVLNEQQ